MKRKNKKRKRRKATMFGGTQVKSESLLFDMHLDLGLHPCALGSIIMHDYALRGKLRY